MAAVEIVDRSRSAGAPGHDEWTQVEGPPRSAPQLDGVRLPFTAEIDGLRRGREARPPMSSPLAYADNFQATS